MEVKVLLAATIVVLTVCAISWEVMDCKWLSGPN